VNTTRAAALLEGAVDLHVHPAPSPMPRRMDGAEAARLAGEAGFDAIVVKSHHHSTVMDVLALEQAGVQHGDAKLFGGVALNGPVGGINPKAVDLALKMGGRIVWFPTIGSEPIEVLDGDGKVLDDVYRILESIKEHDAILASGHMAPHQITAVFEAAREVGVQRMLVNHPNFVIEASFDDARHWVELGAYIEHSLCMYDEESSFYNWDLDTMVEWIDAVGPKRSTLGSDLGQMNNPLPTDSFLKIVSRLLERGVSEDTVRSMVARNPAELLGAT
jgi:hypothetical protein